MLRRLAFTALILGLIVSPRLDLGADEGMWLPPAIGKELPMETLKKMGCQLEAKDFWSGDGTGLDGAMLQVCDLKDPRRPFGFGSASFVSAQGLIVTNHHVAFEAVAGVSDKEHDFIGSGFFAKNLAEERPIKDQGVRLTTVFEDVTAKITDGIAPDADGETRERTVARNRRKVEAAARESGLEDVEVKEMYSGRAYYLCAYQTFLDVRLVCVPPQSIGEYGGDIDNWMWPRHTGDFAFMRAYVSKDGKRSAYSPDNVPYQPKRWLEVGMQGYEPGSFVFIMGYPGETLRFRTAASLDYRLREYYPVMMDRLSGAMADLEKQGENDAAARIANASEIKSLANTLKNFQGMVEGLQSTGLIARKRAEEAEFQKWVMADPARTEKWGHLLADLDAVYVVLDKQATLDRLRQLPFLGAYALAERHAKPEGREAAALQNALEASPAEDQGKALKAVIVRALSLPVAERPECLAGFEASNLDARIAELLPEPFTKEAIRGVLERASEGGDSGSALDRFGRAVAREAEENQKLAAGFNRKVMDIRFVLEGAIAAWRNRPEYPDANSTLRFTYGKVAGYSPRDGVDYNWYTTPRGIVEKHTGQTPFDAPAALLDAVARSDWGRWADAKLGFPPVNFLADTDITGGNSGSPILNAKGQIIGLAFDGNYEAMTSDYQYQPAITRTINVDIRYVCWCLEKLLGMERLVDEMTVAK